MATHDVLKFSFGLEQACMLAFTDTEIIDNDKINAENADLKMNLTMTHFFLA